jgi:serine protease DegQ
MGIGFAIPVSLARTVLAQIIKDGSVTRGWLGVEPQAITREGSAGARTGANRRRARARIAARRSRRSRRHSGARRGRRDSRESLHRTCRNCWRGLPSFARLQCAIKVVRDGKPLDVDVIIARRPRIETQ